VSVRDVEGSRVEAIKQFRLAASIQPDFADAHAGHAYLLSLTLPEDIGMTWDELIVEQRRVNARALQLDADNDLALVAKASALQNFYGEVDQALAIGQGVLRRSPNFGPGHYSIAASLWMQGRSREALDHVEQAIERDPFDTFTRLYRAAILYSLGDYEAVRDAVRECRQACMGNAWLWLIAMAGFATPEQVESDFPLLAKWATAQGASSENIAEVRGIVEGLVVGRTHALKPFKDGEIRDFTQAALAARLRSFEDGLRYARIAADRAQPDRIIDILNEGRVTFTPEQRADPRYHTLFRHPKLIRIAAARRKQGVTAGLPAFPVQPYTGR
jgi:tetratricopeptide (TPR) repeat protein